MTSSPLITAIVALVGVLLGGGIQAFMQHRARRLEAASVLQALLAEVDALVRLAQHREYLENISLFRAACEAMIADGAGKEPGPMMVLDTGLEFFKTYDALIPKIGMLSPWYADRITRFYLYSKSVVQNYTPTSPFQDGMTAEGGLRLFTSDALLLETALLIGRALSADRKVSKPPRATDSSGAIENVMAAGAPEQRLVQAPNSEPLPSGYKA